MSSTTHSMDATKEQEKRLTVCRCQADQDTLIAERTLHKWERAGRPRGKWEVYWLEAEQELIASFEARTPPR